MARAHRVGVNAEPPSITWARSFDKHNKEFKATNAQPIPAKKVVHSTVDHITKWFEKATEIVNPFKVRPSLTFNMDETMLDSTPKQLKVIVPSENSIFFGQDN